MRTRKKDFDIKEKYCDNLPQRVEPDSQCQVLLANGNRCQNQSYAEVSAGLDTELYDKDVNWIAFKVCKRHYELEPLLHGK